MAVDSKTKKKVSADWMVNFEDLYPFEQNKLYKRIGPFVVGIELINLRGSDYYRPHFAVYPLYGNKNGNDLTACLSIPVIYYEFYDNRGLQFSIPYNDVRDQYKVAISSANAQIPISLKDDVTLQSFLNLINEQLQTNIVKVHSGKQAALYELKIYCALFVGDAQQIEKIKVEIQKEAQHWETKIFEVWHGKYGAWMKAIEEKIEHRDRFNELISRNMEDPKLAKLKKSAMV